MSKVKYFLNYHPECMQITHNVNKRFLGFFLIIHYANKETLTITLAPAFCQIWAESLSLGCFCSFHCFVLCFTCLQTHLKCLQGLFLEAIFNRLKKLLALISSFVSKYQADCQQINDKLTTLLKTVRSK